MNPIQFTMLPGPQADTTIGTMVHTLSLQTSNEFLVYSGDSRNIGIGSFHACGQWAKAGRANGFLKPEGDVEPAESLHGISGRKNLTDEENDNSQAGIDVDACLSDQRQIVIHDANNQHALMKSKVGVIENPISNGVSGLVKPGLHIQESPPQWMQPHAAMERALKAKIRNNTLLKPGIGSPTAKKKSSSTNARKTCQAPVAKPSLSGIYPNLHSPVSAVKLELQRLASPSPAMSGGKNERMSPDQRKRVRINELLNAGVYIEKTGSTQVKNVSCVDPSEKQSAILREQRHHWMQNPRKIPYIGFDDSWQLAQDRKASPADLCLMEQHAWLQARLSALSVNEPLRQQLLKKLAFVGQEIQRAREAEKSPQTLARGLDRLDDEDLIHNLKQAFINRKKNGERRGTK